MAITYTWKIVDILLLDKDLNIYQIYWEKTGTLNGVEGTYFGMLEYVLKTGELPAIPDLLEIVKTKYLSIESEIDKEIFAKINIKNNPPTIQLLSGN